MKVTVCFGSIRVIVPCGNGDITVADLQEKACVRYRRAIGKEATYFVKIIKLESSNDGGILDVEDSVNDVVEDKDKLIAMYEEEDPSQADWEQGSAASSDGRNSSLRPSHTTTQLSSSNEYEQRYFSVEKRNSPHSFTKNTGSLEIRAENEVNKNEFRSSYASRESDFSWNPYSSKRISSEQVMNGYGDFRDGSIGRYSSTDEANGDVKLRKRLSSRERTYANKEDIRLSLPISHQLPITPTIEEAYYASSNSNSLLNARTSIVNDQINAAYPVLDWYYKNSREIRFVNDGTIEAIRVREYFDSEVKSFVGLLVQSIKQKSSTHDSLLRCGDVIIGINERLLMDYDFNEAESLLTQSLSYPEVLFRVLQPNDENTSHGIFHNGASSALRSEMTVSASHMPTSLLPPLNMNATNKTFSSDDSSNPHSPSSRFAMPPDLASHLTKKHENRVLIQLVKGFQGLGFSLASNETKPGDPPSPVYVQQILPNGAAMKSRKMAVGDKLLEVNGVNVVGKTQEDIVNQLRAINIGSTVNILVSRQPDNVRRKLEGHAEFKVYRCPSEKLWFKSERVVMKADPHTNQIVNNEHGKEHFTFDIALNDTGSAGLGISLKGNQNKLTGKDMGVFVRSVLHGGAACQDGRLQPNDQLLEVNGNSLLGKSNQDAIEILRTSMSTEGNVRGMIEMKIARRKMALGATNRMSSDASSEMSDPISNEQNSTRPDSPEIFHVKQSSLPSSLLETSFGPDDIGDVTSQSFCSFTLGRTKKEKKAQKLLGSPFHYHSHSNSSNAAEMDTMDAAMVSEVQQKILNSSSSSSSILGNLLNSSDISSTKPSSDPYSTWTLPRTNRVLKRTLSLKSNKSGTVESIASTLNNLDSSNDLQRSELDKITAGELGSNSAIPSKKDVKIEETKKKNVVRSESSKTNRSKHPELVENGVVEKVPEESTTKPISSVQMRKPRRSEKVSTVQKENKRNEMLSHADAKQNGVQRSLSIESIVATATAAETNNPDGFGAHFDESQEVGPCLGIAKSSSLESLQTAVEACNAERNSNSSAARPLPKAVRGRVLNDSFRAALNRTYELSENMPALKQLETPQSNHVLEDGFPPHVPPVIKSNDNTSKSAKRRSKFFGLFKTTKTKKMEASPSSNIKLSEKDEHKRSLDARREKDFERMKEENERIQKKAREMRQKQAADRKKEKHSDSDSSSRLSTVSTPRSPSRSESTKKYLKDNSDSHKHTVNSKDLTKKDSLNDAETDQTQTLNSRKNRRRSKSENRKFKETAAAYNSLPRQPRRGNSDWWDDSSLSVADASSVHPMDSLSFYNRHKPDLDDTSRTLPQALSNKLNLKNNTSFSPEYQSKKPASVSHNDRRTASVRKPAETNVQKPFKSPESEKISARNKVLLRKDFRPDPNSATTIRHSIYTDKPYAFAHYGDQQEVGRKSESNSGQALSDESWLKNRVAEEESNSSAESHHTASSSGLEVVERNSRGYYRIKRSPQAENGAYEKIEMSTTPCSL